MWGMMVQSPLGLIISLQVILPILFMHDIFCMEHVDNFSDHLPLCFSFELLYHLNLLFLHPPELLFTRLMHQG